MNVRQVLAVADPSARLGKSGTINRHTVINRSAPPGRSGVKRSVPRLPRWNPCPTMYG